MDKLPQLNFDFRLNSTEKVFFLPRKSFFTSLLNLIFHNNSENACLVIHVLTNQMQIKLNSLKKNKIRFGKFFVNLGLYAICCCQLGVDYNHPNTIYLYACTINYTLYKGSAWAPAFAGAHASGRAGQHFDNLTCSCLIWHALSFKVMPRV